MLRPLSVLLFMLNAPAQLRVTRPDDPPPPLIGPWLASGSARAWIGEGKRRRVRVWVYRDRVTIAVPFNPRRTIMAEHLVELYYDPGNILRLDHTACGILTPLCLKLRLPHRLHDAILEVFDNRPRIDETA